MKLDKRILPGKRPLGCFDTEEARKFEGEQGCFSDAPINFAYGNEDLSKTTFSGKLKLTEDYIAFPFLNMTNSTNYRFFLPVAWLKPEEPEIKWRAFSLAEWIEQHEIGEVIHYRSKSEGIEFRHMYMGYAFGTGKDITKLNVGTLTLGVASYCFDYLFVDYEIEINNKWQPFGVEDKE